MSDEPRQPITYREAGVDTAEGARAVDRIRESVRSTYRPEVIGDIGGFGGMFSAAALKGMDDPVLVSGTDGVGTKLVLAQLLGKHETVGIDLVAMCVNDILVMGAEPLFFLDYIAIGRLDSQLVESVVAGIAEGCRQAGCALVGGEMAEHPDVMEPGDYDLSGFCVGVVDRPKAIDGTTVAPGDVILGLASSGLHSNGFSLVRRALVTGREAELLVTRVDLGGRTLGEALLDPTRIYVRSVLDLLASGTRVKAMAHITGGGITENLDRCLPQGVDALVHRGSWRVPRVIETVVEAAGLPEDEAYRTFNMGIGFALVVDSKDAADIAVALRAAGETVYEIGEIVAGEGRVRYR
ncbi:MAG: phosphoribosylformylglycinamidine cyclo-ligase [Coriobacteriia bacterium]|nr:phosphoribosylformylglycinamidine cyclo-ligase [Coriobacteriia bacterium]